LKTKLFLLGITAVLMTSNAQANLLDFEGLTTEAMQNLNSVTDNYGGFTWSPSFTLYNSNAFPTPVHSGSYAVVNDDGADPISISATSAFDFGGVWLGGWSINAPVFVTLSGFDAANNLVASLTQILAQDVEVYAKANFKNINRLEFSGGQYFTVDDFTFSKSKSNVSDPGSLFLLTLGILALAVVRRKSADAIH